jgi:hypothetical protein
MVNTFQFILEPYKGQRTRHTCPSCGKARQFTRYIDTQTKQPLGYQVGKCNRENNCGYHYTPSQFFRDNPEAGAKPGEDWKHSEAWKTDYRPPIEKPVQYLPWEVLNKTQTAYHKNNFTRFLTVLFGEEKALYLAHKYSLGTSNRYQNHKGKAVIFWQIDKAGNIRQAKVMAYHPQTGKRIKEEGKQYISFMGKSILKDKEANLQQCLFGEHLLPKHPSLPVALVESEKTAVVMAGFLPDVVWLATGGKNGARWTNKNVYKALEGRKVIIYPDLGAFNEWAEKAKILGTVCTYQVSRLLEQKAQGDDRREGYDLADYFIKSITAAEATANNTERTQARKKQSSLAQTPTPQAEGLPPSWKYQTINNKHKVLIDADGLPAIWNYCPKDDLERAAIEAEEDRLEKCMVGA